MDYIQITIAVNDSVQDYLIGVLSQFSPTGFEQKEESLIVYFEEDHFKSYDINKALTGFAFQIHTVKEQNWNTVWESNFEPVVISDFCAIRAHFHAPIKNVDHEIVITPKMSFGTGHHATTYMMVEQMRTVDFKNKMVFDFGTGTGLLAIMAEKLGAVSVTAIDNDVWSIENAVENFKSNRCTKIKLTLAEVIPLQKFDIILANINKNVLLQNAGAIKKACNQNAFVLLSGLLAEDEKEVVTAYEQNDFHFLQQKNKANWISLLFTNKQYTV